MIDNAVPKHLRRFRAEEWVSRKELWTLKPPWNPMWLAAKRWRDAVVEWARENGLSPQQSTIMLYQCDPFANRSSSGKPLDEIEATVVGDRPDYPIDLKFIEPEFEWGWHD